jgi:hypothetical protein
VTVAYACRHDGEFRAFAEAPLPAATDQRGYDEAHRRFRAKVIQRVLDRGPYDAALFEDARRVQDTEALRADYEPLLGG